MAIYLGNAEIAGSGGAGGGSGVNTYAAFVVQDGETEDALGNNLPATPGYTPSTGVYSHPSGSTFLQTGSILLDAAQNYPNATRSLGGSVADFLESPTYLGYSYDGDGDVLYGVQLYGNAMGTQGTDADVDTEFVIQSIDRETLAPTGSAVTIDGPTINGDEFSVIAAQYDIVFNRWVTIWVERENASIWHHLHFAYADPDTAHAPDHDEWTVDSTLHSNNWSPRSNATSAITPSLCVDDDGRVYGAFPYQDDSFANGTFFNGVERVIYSPNSDGTTLTKTNRQYGSTAEGALFWHLWFDGTYVNAGQNFTYTSSGDIQVAGEGTDIEQGQVYQYDKGATAFIAASLDSQGTLNRGVAILPSTYFFETGVGGIAFLPATDDDPAQIVGAVYEVSTGLRDSIQANYDSNTDYISMGGGAIDNPRAYRATADGSSFTFIGDQFVRSLQILDGDFLTGGNSSRTITLANEYSDTNQAPGLNGSLEHTVFLQID